MRWTGSDGIREASTPSIGSGRLRDSPGSPGARVFVNTDARRTDVVTYLRTTPFDLAAAGASLMVLIGKMQIWRMKPSWLRPAWSHAGLEKHRFSISLF